MLGDNKSLDASSIRKCKSELERLYVAQFLVPTLSPGDVVILDNLSSHKGVAVRKAAERTVEATWQRIGSLLDAFPPQECANYLRNSGYASI